MARVTPGDYMLYCPPNRPPWPAVIVTNDMLPPAMRKGRLYTCETPIFLFQKLEVRWVSVSDLREIRDYICPDDLPNKYPGLREAHAFLLDAIADGFDLSHWGSVITAMHGFDNPLPLPQELDKDDSDINKAVEASLSEQIRTKRVAPNEAEDDEELTTESPAMKPKKQLQAPENGLPIRNSGGITVSREHGGQAFPDQRAGRVGHAPSTTISGAPISGRDLDYSDSSHPPLDDNASSSDVSGFNASAPGTGHSSTSERAQSTDSTEDDDELMGKDMTCWIIGPNLEKFYIPLIAVTEREHLKKMGILLPNGRHGWTVTKPSFADIDPNKFRPVAEFLSTGDFKSHIHSPTGELLEEEELKFETISLCADAWEVAENLALHDMMETIVSKMKAIRPWSLLELIMFATRVYSVPSVPAFPVDADIEMKGLISSFISANYNEYVTGDEQSAFFEMLEQFPELRRDVHQAMASDAAEAMDRD